MEHAVGLAVAQLAHRADWIARFNEAVSGPHSIAHNSAEGTFLQQRKLIVCFGLDHLSRRCEVDRTKGIVALCLQFLCYAGADQALPRLLHVPLNQLRTRLG